MKGGSIKIREILLIPVISINHGKPLMKNVHRLLKLKIFLIYYICIFLGAVKKRKLSDQDLLSVKFFRSKGHNFETKGRELILEEKKLALEERKLLLEEQKFDLEKKEREEQLRLEIREKENAIRISEQQQKLLDSFMNNFTKH